MCDNDVCERWCVTKMCLCDKDGVRQRWCETKMVCDKEGEAEEEEAGGTDPKTRTPHNDVGNKLESSIRTLQHQRTIVHMDDHESDLICISL